LCSVDTPNYISGGGGGSYSGYVPFSFGVITGLPNAPIDGNTFWQSDTLINGLNLNYLILNDTYLTLAKGDFTFDSSTGIIDMSPNRFFDGDVLVGNYFKKI
jgi:hypothetical protein